MKKFFLIVLAACFFMMGCSKKEKVVIWTSGEDYKNEMYLNSLREKFPQYDISLEYMSTSNIAAKILEEKSKSSCDIVCSEEYGYLMMCEDLLADLDGFDFSVFQDNIVPASRKFVPESMQGGCIILNRKMLESRGLPVPRSYEDLLNPAYKNLVSMPSPASSGTGYMFLLQLANEWGEDKAFAYFDKLAGNVLQFTTSGSGPVNALVQGEAAIGLGMTGQAVFEVNQGVGLEITFFKEGSPYNMYGNAIVKKGETRECVREVFDYLSTDLCRKDNELYFPERIFKDFAPEVEGFPKNVKYGNMSENTVSRKKALQAKWRH